MPETERIPIVAIVGRPNVGKSTLFNRYAGHRRALVADSPGLTRDRIVEEIELADRRFLLVDTAGLDPSARDGLTGAMQAQAEAAVAEADAILFVVDGKAGLLPEDATIAATLRKTRKPLGLVVNKIDRPDKHADRILDFYQLGFERVNAVSAEHGGGAFDALEELVKELPECGPAPDVEGELRVAIVGRPNVGKSSLTNRLLGEERVVVSDVAGTTRDSIDTRLELEGDAFVLVDTAGLRRPGRRSGTGEKIGALMTVRSLERAQVALLLVDASEGFTDQDAHVARMIRDLGCSAVVVINKWDVVRAEGRKAIREQVAHGLRFMADAPQLALSAKTGKGVRKLFPLVRRVAESAGRWIGTAELNRWMADAVAKHDPGIARRGPSHRQVKFQYASQVGVYPPKFVLFCTDADAVGEAYRRYLENRLRDTFDIEGSPIQLILRSRRRGDAVPDG
jgi:GTP-binding protein